MSRLFFRRLKTVRHGAATIEFALVFPILILFMLGIVELGRAMMVQHALEDAARAGCRIAVYENGGKQEVIDIVESAMGASNITGYSVEVTPDPPTGLDPYEPVTVKISLPFQAVSWVTPSYLTSGRQLSGACVMPAEGDWNKGFTN